MKKIILLSFILFHSTFGSYAQHFDWATKLEGSYFTNQPNAQNFNIPPGGDFLAAGNTIIAQTGFFKLNITFGNQTFVSADTLDAFLSVHDQAGNLLWVKQLMGNTPVQPSLVVDLHDNIYISGFYADSLYIDNLVFKSSNLGKGGIYIIKFDAAGNRLWARSSAISNGNPGTYFTETSMALDGAGNINVAGNFSDTLTFDGTSIIAGPQQNLFIANYSANGTLQWLRAPTAGGIGIKIKPDAAGNLYVLKIHINPTFTYSIIIQKIDPTGAVSWSNFYRQFFYYGINFTLDGAGNPVLSGYYSGGQMIGNFTLTTANFACFLAKLDTAGNWRWARNIADDLDPGSAFYFAAPQLTLSPNQQITVAGVYLGANQFPGSAASTLPNSTGTFIMQTDTAGTLDWVTTIKNDSTWHNWIGPAGITTDPQGNLYVSGSFASKAHFGTTMLSTANSETTFLTKILVANNPLSIKKPKAGLQPFQLYPNPAKDYVMVAAELKKPTAATVRLVNILGQTISEVTLPANSQLHYQLPLNNLPKGVYIVQLENEQGRQAQRLVVQ